MPQITKVWEGRRTCEKVKDPLARCCQRPCKNKDFKNIHLCRSLVGNGEHGARRSSLSWRKRLRGSGDSEQTRSVTGTSVTCQHVFPVLRSHGPQRVPPSLNKLPAGLGGPSHALNLQIALAIPRYIMKHHESPHVYENAYRPYFALGRSEQTDAKLMGTSAS